MTGSVQCRRPSGALTRDVVIRAERIGVIFTTRSRYTGRPGINRRDSFVFLLSPTANAARVPVWMWGNDVRDSTVERSGAEAQSGENAPEQCADTRTGSRNEDKCSDTRLALRRSHLPEG
jgi:hypothetical protein